MSEAQADLFSKTHTVLDQYTDSATGVSATLFRNNQTGERCVAVRGTELQTGDLLADALLALGVSSVLNPQYLALKAQMTEWLSDPSLLGGQTFTVAGHSLGGYLAAALKADYAQATAAYLYNAPGNGGLFGNIGDLVSSLFTQSAPGENGIWNIKGSEGASLIAGLGGQPSDIIPIQIEAAPGAGLGNHSIIRLVDALAVQTLYAELLPSLSPDDLNILIDASGTTDATLEPALDALRKLILGPDTERTSPDRNAQNGKDFYTHLYALQDNATYQALQGQVSAEILLRNPDQAQSLEPTLRQNAQQNNTEGLAWRYALDNLNPFVLTGIDYAQHNANGELDLYDPQTGTGSQTDDYLADRAAFLARKLWFSLNDNKAPVNPQVEFNPAVNHPYEDEIRYYEDIDSGYTIAQGYINTETPRYLFGGQGSDVVTGQQGHDHLYGLGGLDVLTGGKGDDHLEGGEGLDFYRFQTGDGQDTILDTDGKAVIQRNEELFTLGTKTGDGTWTGGTGNNTFTATQNGTDLILTFTDGENDSITLKNFDFDKAATAEGSYGLRLIPDLPARPEGEPNVVGGPADWNKVLTGQYPDSDDIFQGWSGNDLIDSGGLGNDRVDPSAGRDRVHVGHGNDWIEGGADGDILYGEADNDVIFADTSNEGELTLEAAIKNGETGEAVGGEADMLAGSLGDDTLIGGASEDVLLGGQGRDILVGGPGDNNLFGDAVLNFATLDWWAERVIDEVEFDGVMIKHYRSILHDVMGNTNDDGGEADLLIGGAGNDWAFGGGGDDLVLGGTGNDVLFGNAGDDILQGGDGDDVLGGEDASLAESQCGDDILDGGAGNDSLWGYAGDDVLNGGADDDELSGDDGDDILIGGTGNDTLYGGAGKDVYIYNKGDGKDIIYDKPVGIDDPEASVLILGPGISRADVMFRLGSLHIDIGDGEGVHFADFDQNDPYATPVVGEIRFDDGSVMSYQDILAQGFDIDGTADDDTLVGSAATDRMRGAEGNDSLWGMGGGDSLLGGEGDDHLMGDNIGSQLAGEFHGDDYLDGGAGNDTLFGMGGNDTLIGGAGQDYLEGGDGADTYLFNLGDGQDVIVEGLGDNVIRFGEGIGVESLSVIGSNNWIVNGKLVSGVYLGYGNQGDAVLIPDGLLGRIERLEFADDQTLTWAQVMEHLPAQNITGSNADDHIIGTPANDTIRGMAGNDTLAGLAGHDTLIGGDGNDTLAGGTGSDRLEGGAGDDVYLFNPGDGTDTIIDTAGADTVVFGEGLDPADLNVRAVRTVDGTQTLEIDFGTDDSLIIGNGHLSAIEHFRFADDSEMSLNDLMQRVTSYVGSGTADDDIMEGSSGDDALRGFGGNDTLLGNAGDDLLEGGDGDDILDGGDGNDDLFGGAGNDTLIGGDGRDTYTLHLGMGADRVIEAGGQQSLIRVDTLLSGSDLIITRVGDDLRIEINGTSDSLTLADYYTANSDWMVDTGNGEMSLGDFLATATDPVSGTPYEQALTHYQRALELAHQWNLATQGYAREADGMWHNRLSGTPVHHYIDTGLVFETVQCDDWGFTIDWMQQVQISSTSSVEQQTTFHIPSGGGGTPMPQNKAEPYFMPAGVNFSYRWGDQLIQANDSAGNFLGFWVYPREWFAGSQSSLPGPGTFQEVNVTTYTYYEETRSLLVEASGDDNWIGVGGGAAADGGAGNDVISSSGYGDWYHYGVWSPMLQMLLYGNDGDDTLTGGAGDDFLIGGAGRDVLDGGYGADRYYLENESAGDLIVDRGEIMYFDSSEVPSVATENDVVIFPEGVAVGDLRFSWNDELFLLQNWWYENLGGWGSGFEALEMATVLTISWGIDNCVRIYMPNAEREPGGIEEFRFSDGTTLTRAQLLALAPEHDLDPREQANLMEGSGVFMGFGGDDTISGDAEGYMIDGGDGNDLIMGGGGLDWITGGRGADTLIGGDGDSMLGYGLMEFWSEGNTYRGGAGDDLLLGTVNSDIYHFDLGDGQDVITDFFHQHQYFGDYQDELHNGGPAFFEAAGAPDNLASLRMEFDWQKWQEAAQSWSYLGRDTIRLGEGIHPEDITISVEDNGDWVLSHINGEDSIRVEAGDLGKENPIERIEFANGMVWDATGQLISSNHAPEVGTLLLDQQAEQNAPFTFTVPTDAFTDIDAGDILTYSATLANGDPLPAWLGFDAATQTLTGTPADSDIGSLQLRITATDPAGASASQLFSLEVTSDNDPQRPVTVPDTADVPEDGILTGNVLANDSNTGEVTSFQIDGDPTIYQPGDTATFTEGTLTLAGNGDYVFTPTQDYAGQVPQVTYTTSSGSSSTLDITIMPVAEAPTITIELGEPTQSGSASAWHTIDTSNHTRTDQGYTVQGLKSNGAPGVLATFNGGIGVGLYQDPRENTGDAAGEISYNPTTNTSEKLVVSFDAPVAQANVALRELNTQEYARVTAYDGDNKLVFAETVHGKGSSIDTPVTIAIDGTQISRIEFTAPGMSWHTNGSIRDYDDFVVRSVSYETLGQESMTVRPIESITVTPTDIDHSEQVTGITLSLPDGVLLSAGTNNGDGSWTLPMQDDGDYAVTVDPVTGAVSISGLEMWIPSGFSGEVTVEVTATVADRAVVGLDTLVDTGVFDSVGAGMVLMGGSGDDILMGGIGSDILIGDAGDDIYVFSMGDGQDTIHDSQGSNTVRFLDVRSDEIALLRSGDDLKLLYGESDALTIQDHFADAACQMASYEFADVTIVGVDLTEMHGM